MRGDSTLDTLKNAGSVAFTQPRSGAFKTLTVKNYEGGGTLSINTRLGDDNSPTDRLVIDGGAATGNTGLRVVNAGGVGGQTTRGIRVVETINGGVTASDAFHLDAGSTGYRASIGTLALNGYDYSLVRGGNGGVADDWYLTSEYDGSAPPGPIDPLDPTDPTDPTGPTRPARSPTDPIAPPEVVDPSGFRNVSPETGAYAGNQRAAMNLFSHGLRDRVAAPDANADAGHGNRLWTRALARHDGGLRMAEGKVEVGTDSTLLQIGGDVLRTRLGSAGALQAGLMAGYGDARTRSDATLRLPGSGQTVQTRARVKVSGYSVGLYATAYANDATRLGAYADAWLQYGRYDNRISSDLGALRYDADVWSASLETGYALRPFVAGSALADLVVGPRPNCSTATTRPRTPRCRARACKAASATPSPPAPACASIPRPRPMRRNRRSGRSWKPTGSTRPAPRPCAWAPTRWTRPVSQRARTQARRARADRTQCASLGPGHRPARQRRPAWLRRHAERQLSLVVSVGGATRRANW